MHMHPEAHLWLTDQDRERAMTQRALERAARSGGVQTPGLARGGITSLARVLRRAGSAASHLRVGAPRPSADPTGSPSI